MRLLFGLTLSPIRKGGAAKKASADGEILSPVPWGAGGSEKRGLPPGRPLFLLEVVDF